MVWWLGCPIFQAETRKGTRMENSSEEYKVKEWKKGSTLEIPYNMKHHVNFNKTFTNQNQKS